MSLIIPANSAAASGGYAVDDSLRFNVGSSDYLNRTQGTATSAKIFTLSMWVKISTLGEAVFFSSYYNSTNRFQIYFNANGTLTILNKSSGSTNINVQTNRVFRDISAWYNLIVAIDTTQGTDTNRVKLYVNGVQETSFSTATYPSVNNNISISGSNYSLNLGRYGGTGSHFGGYMSEVVFVDGTAQANTDLGEFDEDSGIWKPIDVSGLTFGDNGFYLDFENSGALGADVSGESNNFTVNNLTAIDQSTDTCTNNFATLNPLNANIGATVPTLSEGNLRTSNSITNKMQTQYSTIAPSTGKFYCEVKATAGSVFRIGISSYNSNQAQGSSDNQNRPGQFSEGWGYDKTGTIYKTESSIATYTAYNTGDIICIALDMTNKKLYFRRDNNAWENSANLATGSNGIDISSIPSGTGMAFGAGLEAGSVGAAYADFNFGSPPYAISSGNTDGNGYGNFEYAVPSGYYALNTKNLAEYG